VNEEIIWKNIPNFPLYQVSNVGVVRRLDKYGSRALYLCPDVGVYKRERVTLTNKEGKHIHLSVSHLVAEAFIEPKPVWAEEINHKDGNSANNKPSNLEWCTRSENCKHAIYTLKTSRLCNQDGELNTSSKLTNESVSYILTHRDELYGRKNIQNRKVLATRLGVQERNIRDILNGVLWKHIIA
jgi:hypothetical protein